MFEIFIFAHKCTTRAFTCKCTTGEMTENIAPPMLLMHCAKDSLIPRSVSIIVLMSRTNGSNRYFR